MQMESAGATPVDAPKSSQARAPGAKSARPAGPSGPPKSPRRGLVTAGAILAFGVLLAYGLQFVMGLLSVPWYVPITGTIGALMLLVAAAAKRSFMRVALVVLALVFAGVEWTYLLSWSVLPAYVGPVEAGQQFPNFAAMRTDGARFTQDNLHGEMNTLLVFFRGRWCPYCMQELSVLNSRWREFDARRLQIVAVSIESSEEAQKTQQEFPNLILLSDPDKKLAEAAGVYAAKQGLDVADTSMPTSFLIDDTGRVVWVYRPSHVVSRASPDVILRTWDELKPRVW